MSPYLLLLRGINVGGKNRVPMAELKACLEDLGCSEVTTYIASGNAVVTSDKPARELRRLVEDELPRRFALDTELVSVLVLARAELEAVVRERPEGFGDEPGTYHSDAIFLIGIGVDEALRVFKPREGVDAVWPGTGVIYSRRLSAERTKSRLGAIIGTPAYKKMTIRSWQTTAKLLELMESR